MAETALLPPPPPRHPVRAVRIIKARPRLSIAAAVAVVTIALLFAVFDWRAATKLLVGWNIGVALYLALALYLMWRSDVHRIRRRAAMQDESQITILVLTVAAAIASLAAIFSELSTTVNVPRQPGQLILATTTIVLSWAFIHVMFALHYAHEYYGDGRDHIIGGLSFPGRQGAGLLGLHVFLVRHRHVRAGVGCDDIVEIDPPHRAGARHHLVRVQCGVAGADREHRGECDLGGTFS